MSKLVKMYADLPLIPPERFFRIKGILILNHKRDHILTYGMFSRTYPELYPKNSCTEFLVSPVMILSSYNNAFRIPHNDWSRFKTINKEVIKFPVFVDTNNDWISQLEN
jgi:hypothetical protein